MEKGMEQDHTELVFFCIFYTALVTAWLSKLSF